MLCPVCGCDTLKVVNSVQRGDDSDVRNVVCSECGKMFWTRTVIEGIILGADKHTIDAADEIIKTAQKRYYSKKISKMNRLGQLAMTFDKDKK